VLAILQKLQVYCTGFCVGFCLWTWLLALRGGLPRFLNRNEEATVLNGFANYILYFGAAALLMTVLGAFLLPRGKGALRMILRTATCGICMCLCPSFGVA